MSLTSCGINRLTREAARATRAKADGSDRHAQLPTSGRSSTRLPLDQGRQLEQIAHPERATTSRQRHERIDRRTVSPGGRHPPEPALLVIQPDAILAPVLQLPDELELAPTQRMKRMGYPNA